MCNKQEALVEIGYSITQHNGQAYFNFSMKSQENGIPFGCVNFNSLLISATQAMADTYSEINRLGLDLKLEKLRTDFERKITS